MINSVEGGTKIQQKPKIDMLESMMLDTHFLNYFCEEDLGKGLKGAESHRSDRQIRSESSTWNPGIQHFS